MRKVALFCILTNLFNVWLKTRQLESLICFCSPSVAISHYYNLWIKLHCPFTRKWEWKGQTMSLYCYENSFKLAVSLKRSWGLPGAPGPSWRTAALCCWGLAVGGQRILNPLQTVKSFSLRFSANVQRQLRLRGGTTGLKPKCQPRSGRHWKRRKWARSQTTQGVLEGTQSIFLFYFEHSKSFYLFADTSYIFVTSMSTISI